MKRATIQAAGPDYREREENGKEREIERDREREREREGRRVCFDVGRFCSHLSAPTGSLIDQIRN
jgi:hypothetical protein